MGRLSADGRLKTTGRCDLQVRNRLKACNAIRVVA
jgi:hypothetical protein